MGEITKKRQGELAGLMEDRLDAMMPHIKSFLGI